MKILTYEFESAGWKFNKFSLQNVNLIVGDSGAGKTRLLNTIFNLGACVAQSKLRSGRGNWKIAISANQQEYSWDVTTREENDKVFVEQETLLLNGEPIIERKGNILKYKGSESPKLTTNQMSISILKEEELIKPLFDGFSKILRRKFFMGEPNDNSSIFAVNEKSLDKLGEKKDLFEIYKSELGLNPRLYLLQKYFLDIYEKVITYFREAFPFVTKVEILDSSVFDQLSLPGRVPIFCITEQNVDNWIRLDDLSTGMQKTLLILTDLFSLPDDTIYLIDEYENSLGMSAINTLPNVLFSEDIKLQILVTSHHPYIISKFPVENWYIAHRKGSDVVFEYGDSLVKKYGASSQDKYIQLLNDPNYMEGVK